MLVATLTKPVALFEGHEKVFIAAGESVACGTFNLLIEKLDTRVEHIANAQCRIFTPGQHGHAIRVTGMLIEPGSAYGDQIRGQGIAIGTVTRKAGVRWRKSFQIQFAGMIKLCSLAMTHGYLAQVTVHGVTGGAVAFAVTEGRRQETAAGGSDHLCGFVKDMAFIASAARLPVES